MKKQIKQAVQMTKYGFDNAPLADVSKRDRNAYVRGDNMNRRLFLLCISLLILLSFCGTAEAVPKVMVDYKTVNFEVDPVIENGTTLVPLRAIFEVMGAKVTWDENTKTATAEKDDTIVILPVGSLGPTINGEPYQLEVPAKIINDRTLAPLRFVGEAFGAEVIWNSEKQSIEITTSKIDGIPEQAKKLETWEKIIGKKAQANCVQQTRDGSYIITGGKNKDIYLVKLNLKGDVQWEKTYGGDQTDYGAYVQETLDGGYIITGNTESFGAKWGDVFLIKTDSNGNKEWEKTFGRSGEDFGSYVQQTADGGYMIAGTLEPGGEGTLVRELWLIKTDNDGNFEWDNSFGYDWLFRGWSGLQTRDGGYIIAGDTSDDRKWDIYTVKVDSKGNKEWHTFYSGPDMDSISEIRQTMDGGYIIVGDISNGSWEFDINLIKTDSHGELVWQASYGTEYYDIGSSVVQVQDGSYYVVGTGDYLGNSSTSSGLLMKIDAQGELEWNKTFSDEVLDISLSSLQPTYDGGLIIVGYKRPHGDYSNDTVYILKTDSNGNINSGIR